ncbi:MAG: hypothetical protein CMH57_10930 [Myxococcales bacterium]|nr:hypothetical protein [Myxococcales bacterium]
MHTPTPPRAAALALLMGLGLIGCDTLESPAQAEPPPPPAQTPLRDLLRGPTPAAPPPLIQPEHFPLPTTHVPLSAEKRDALELPRRLEWTRVALYVTPPEAPPEDDPAGVCALARQLGHDVLPRRGLRLVALIRDATGRGGVRAMLEDSSGVGHVVVAGEQLGPMFVANITPEEVVLVFPYRGHVERVILKLGATLCNV